MRSSANSPSTPIDVKLRWLLACSLMAFALPALGQGGAAVTKSPTYDVVSIKPANPNRSNTWMTMPADGFSAGGTTVESLIMDAYDIKLADMVSGLSGPVRSARFDIQARADGDTVAALKKLPREERQAQRRLMMQAMLADRFKLKVHHASKEVSIYVLVIAKGGFKLKEADPKETYPNGIKGPDGLVHPGITMMMSNGRLTAHSISIASFAMDLSGFVHRIVEDKTGLTGNYDIALRWSPDDGRGSAMPGSNEDAEVTAADPGPSIFTALQEQLGLKLESDKEMVDTIVVDHIEMPSEN